MMLGPQIAKATAEQFVAREIPSRTRAFCEGSTTKLSFDLKMPQDLARPSALPSAPNVAEAATSEIRISKLGRSWRRTGQARRTSFTDSTPAAKPSTSQTRTAPSAMVVDTCVLLPC